jgi:hypothetical protein
MKLTERQFRVLYTDYDSIIDGMREKLLEAHRLNPKKDFSDRYATIEKLITLRELFHQIYQYQITLDNNSAKVMTERENFIRRIAKLEKELEALKQNITL